MIFDTLLSAINGGKVLDVGCGTGQFTATLVNSLLSFESITGADVDEDALSKARENFPGRKFTFQTANSQALPFDADFFDMTTISKALHHLEDPSKALWEMYRVLRPGGYLLINEMHREVSSKQQELHLLYHHLRSEIDNALGISHNHTFRKHELLRLISGLRLQNMQVHEFIPETGPPKSQDIILEYSGKMDAWMKELEGHPQRREFTGRIEQVRQRIKQFGISRPPQLVIFGRK